MNHKESLKGYSAQRNMWASKPGRSVNGKRKDKSFIGNGIFDPRLPAKTKGRSQRSSRRGSTEEDSEATTLREVRRTEWTTFRDSPDYFRYRWQLQYLWNKYWQYYLYSIAKYSQYNSVFCFSLLYVSDTCNALWTTESNGSGRVSLPFPLNPRNIIITTKNKTITCPFEDRVTKEQQFASELNNFWSPFLRITSFWVEKKVWSS